MIKVGLIGYGNMGRSHGQLLLKHEDVKLMAMADAREERRAMAARELGVQKTYADGADMIAEGDFDVVFVCAPTYLHKPFAIQALEKGCHVFCEKPMSLNVECCREMAAAAEKTGKNFMIGQVLRFWDEYIYLKKAIDEKMFGELRALSMTRVGGVSVGYEGWFLDEERGGMQIFDRHIHDTDAILWMLGTPKAVLSHGVSYDNRTQGGIFHNFTQYLYDGNIIVSAEGSADTPQGFPFTASYRAFFENGLLEFNSRNKPALLVYKGGAPEEVDLSSSLAELKSGLNITTAGPYFNEQAYFFDCVRKGVKPTTVTAATAMETIRVVKAEIESVRTGKAVTL